MKQNLTLRIDGDIIKKARILAAQKGTSISRLLADYLEEIVRDASRYESAHQQAIELMEAGFDLGGSIPCTRDDWHER